jgi:hypothetical protein
MSKLKNVQPDDIKSGIATQERDEDTSPYVCAVVNAPVAPYVVHVEDEDFRQWLVDKDIKLDGERYWEWYVAETVMKTHHDIYQFEKSTASSTADGSDVVDEDETPKPKKSKSKK